MRARSLAELLAAMELAAVRVPIAGCWLWERGLDRDGYGQAWFRGKNVRAHRLSWALHSGCDVWGVEAQVLHRCDVRCCINPHHLFLGTTQENTADKMLKGRHLVAAGDDHYTRRNPALRSGEKSPSAKLTASQVDEVKAMLGVVRQRDLAKQYGVSRTCISAISTGRNWKHL